MKLFIALCSVLIILISPSLHAVQVEVTTIYVARPTTLDDGSPYINPGGLVWQCGTVPGGPRTVPESFQDNTRLVPHPTLPGVEGSPLSTFLSGQSDGQYFCVVRERAADFPTTPESLESNESESITKAGLVFFVDRLAPTAPTGLILE